MELVGKKKNVLIVGLGKSGIAACKYFANQPDTHITLTDLKKTKDIVASLAQLKGIEFETTFGPHLPETFLAADMIVLSPDVNTFTPLIQQAREKGIRITSEANIALGLMKKPVIAITGTNGKTTTTTLIGEILKAQGHKVFVGGNIGKPLLDYFLEESDADLIVAELSSFQLELIEHITPAVSVFTTIEPDHLDRYPDFTAYVQTKKRLFYLSGDQTALVLNADNPVTAEFAKEKRPHLYLFSQQPIETVHPSVSGTPETPALGAYIDTKAKALHVRAMVGDKLFEKTFDLSPYKAFGVHNKENLAAAVCATLHLGVHPDAIEKVIRSFNGVEHRLEFVRKKDGVFFINDSKGTNANAVHKSLLAFPNNPILLIAGGKDKGADFQKIHSLVKERVKVLILLGESKEMMNRMLGDCTETYLVGTFEEAVLLAFQKSRRGDIVLLSPGCASFDMFKNYEERGLYFKKLVLDL
jgi:UDP-N-acetylmuramoylalanine--D-glutamate ligase